ncbi:MAG: hypothetical protein Q9163_006525, partial [Psora crenata]
MGIQSFSSLPTNEGNMKLRDEAQANYSILRDCVADPIIQKSAAANTSNGKPKRRTSRRKTLQHGPKSCMEQDIDPTTEAEDLADFIDYIATELFTSLPQELQDIAYADIKNDEILAARYDDPLPAATLNDLVALAPFSVIDSLEAYHLSSDNLAHFLTPILTSYVTSATAPPPSTNPS